ncbi:MAG: DsbA family protein [Rhodobacteraceae bacterium]|nr:DsbA family protein [Paracoccaceae bacterium]
MKRRAILVGGAAAAAAAGLWWAMPRGAVTELPALASPARAEDAAAPAVPDMVLGNPDAPVTVVEYASFTCPHCANFHANVWGEFRKNYVDTGKVRFVYREVYFDKFGLWAAMVARCGGEMRYFGIADMIYDTQRDWIGDGTDATIAANLRKIGLKAGMTADQVDACLNDNAMARAMVEAFQKNSAADGVEGTPTFLINGEKHSGEMSYADFAALVDAKLGG